MSWLKLSSLFVVAALFAFTAEARAEHVDWSSYIDHGSPVPASTTPKVASSSSASDDAAPAKASRGSKAKKTVAAKAKSKKSKIKARSKKSRR